MLFKFKGYCFLGNFDFIICNLIVRILSFVFIGVLRVFLCFYIDMVDVFIVYFYFWKKNYFVVCFIKEDYFGEIEVD